MKHRVQINVARQNMESKMVLSSSTRKFSHRLARLLFGDYGTVVILKPGTSVEEIAIKEMTGGERA